MLIVFDALRPDHSSAYGYARPTMPSLERLAEDAVRFETAVAPAAFTLPSVATLFTALDPVEHGVRRHLDPEGREDFLQERFHTLAEILKERGYATGAVVSNSLFLLKTGFEQGFDHFEPGRRRDAGPTTDTALAWLKEQTTEKPFFLWVHYIDPHWPYDAPRTFDHPFHHEDRGQFQRLVRDFEEGRVRSDEIYFENSLDPDGVLRGIAEYDNEIAYADRHMGRLIAWLKQVGHYDRTVVAVVSDHGESLGEHGLHFAHSFTLYDEVQKVVMMLKPGKGVEAVTVRRPVRLLDFMPTVLSQLGIQGGAFMQGRDLSPLWEDPRGGTALPEPTAYGETEPRYRNPKGGFRYPARKRAPVEGNEGKWRMIRSANHKLILVPGEGLELYDLAADPAEQVNLWETRPREGEVLHRQLRDILERDRITSAARDAGAGGSAPESAARVQDEEGARRLIREMGY